MNLNFKPKIIINEASFLWNEEINFMSSKYANNIYFLKMIDYFVSFTTHLEYNKTTNTKHSSTAIHSDRNTHCKCKICPCKATEYK